MRTSETLVRTASTAGLEPDRMARPPATEGKPFPSVARRRSDPQRWFEKVRPAGTLPAVDSKASRLSFEDALTQLEQIVESMEAGETPLAELLAKFEEGNKLLKVCETRLKDAELKIEQLRKQKDGVTFEKLSPGT
jgi:exodeoxyribonuclease VII small subunit